MLSPEVLENIRLAWLKGKSLRALAREQGMTHTLLYSMLKTQFGWDVCNPDTHSLQRSLLRDYKNKPEVLAAVMSMEFGNNEHKYYSYKADNVWSHSRQHDASIVLDRLQADEVEYNEPLRLTLFRFVWYVTAYMIAYTMLITDDKYIQQNTEGIEEI